ncbi:hypothetical protein O9K51_11224 [Purpureocillium lavendulum]|uniref:Uncharacterized protein n=1 Tax=Purpureocillium lavendulum TaxID=1247861 RepID=A0AB34FCS1_9HYPO|nr:hypothetical protein O9K51_11224 [Purpureocillium lavendulum]
MKAGRLGFFLGWYGYFTLGVGPISLTITFIAGGGVYFLAKRSYNARLEERQGTKHVIHSHPDLNVQAKASTVRGIDTPKMDEDEQRALRKGAPLLLRPRA